MLIVSRRIDESIQIGDEITVAVLVIKGKQVRIGVNAPSDVAVHREEVYVRIMRDQHRLRRQSLNPFYNNPLKFDN